MRAGHQLPLTGAPGEGAPAGAPAAGPRPLRRPAPASPTRTHATVCGAKVARSVGNLETWGFKQNGRETEFLGNGTDR
jgi:hypothetical protein